MSGLLVLSCVSSQKVGCEGFSDRGIASSVEPVQTTFENALNPNSEKTSSALAETVGIANKASDDSCKLNFWNCIFRRKASALEDHEIEKVASSSAIKASEAELLIDNDKSFYEKLKAIRNAETSVRAVYFIYTNDDSSSLITNALIEKAKQGKEVKLLVDFVTNYKSMDLFKYMEKEGNGKLSVSFYNFPTERILKDALFLTMPCPKESVSKDASSEECQNSKLASLKANGYKPTYMSKLLLTGIYAKNAAAVKMSIGMGAELDKSDFVSSDSEPTDGEAIKDFFTLLRSAAGGNIGAKIKLQFAMLFYGNKVNPVLNKLTGILPVKDNFSAGEGSGNVTHAQEWDHISDYVHHKLLLVDENEFQLGGRNIEDSYHMKKRLPSEEEGGSTKYIFKDTDMHIKTAGENDLRDIRIAFDKMYDFKNMVADSEKVETYLNSDFIVNGNQIYQAAGACGAELVAAIQVTATFTYKSLDQCIDSKKVQMPGYLSFETRFANLKQQLQTSEKKYLTSYPLMGRDQNGKEQNPSKYFAKSQFSKGLSSADLKNSKIYYLENLPFDKDKEPLERHVGVKFNREAKFDKNIQLMWYKELENACYISQKEIRDVRVIFHNAYLILPSGLTYTLGQMLNGKMGDCSRVRISFLTNSFNTSDLSVINVLARYQMATILKYQEGLNRKLKATLEGWSQKKRDLLAADKAKNKNPKSGWGPRIELHEYYSEHPGSAGFSLHSKLALFDTDIIVGSANLDVRSYHMDTNNAVLIRGANDLATQYKAYFDNLLTDPKMTKNVSLDYLNYYTGVIPAGMSKPVDINLESKAIIDGIIGYFLAKKNAKLEKAKLPKVTEYAFLTPDRKEIIYKEVEQMGAAVASNAYKLLTKRGGDKDLMQMLVEDEDMKSTLNGNLKTVADAYNNMFKLL